MKGPLFLLRSQPSTWNLDCSHTAVDIVVRTDTEAPFGSWQVIWEYEVSYKTLKRDGFCIRLLTILYRFFVHES